MSATIATGRKVNSKMVDSCHRRPFVLTVLAITIAAAAVILPADVIPEQASPEMAPPHSGKASKTAWAALTASCPVWIPVIKPEVSICSEDEKSIFDKETEDKMLVSGLEHESFMRS